MPNNALLDLSGEFSDSLNEIFEACTTAILLVDKYSNIRYCNGVVLDLFGYQPKELLNQPISMLMPPKFRFGHEEMFNRYFTAPQRRQMGNGTIFPSIDKMGNKINVSIGLNTLLLNNENFVVANITQAQENNDRVNRDLQLSDALRIRMINNKRLIQLADASNSSVIITDKQHVITWVNTSLTKLLDKSLEQLIGRPIIDVFGAQKAKLDALFMAYAEQHALKKEFVVELSGIPRHLVMALSPILSEQNSNGNVLYINDITEQLRLQHELDENTHLLTTIARIAKIGHYTLNIATNELNWSDEIYRIHDLPIGTPMDVEKAIGFYTNQSRPIIEKAVESSLQTGEPYDLELPLITASRRDIWVRAVGYVEFIDGEPAMLKGAFQDITHMRLSALEAEKGIRTKSAFLANMSHELRTPINGIMGVSEILAETKLDAQQNEYLSVLTKSASTLLSLVNQILTYAKLEEYPDDVHNSQFSVSTLIQQVAFTHTVASEKKGITFSVSIADDVPDSVVADAEKLEQIINNILSNAVKFTTQGGIKLNVAASRDNELRISVEDTGPGIKDSDQEMLFEAFRQLDMSYARQYDGTGLGLAISKNLVSNIGGRMGVDSELGRGSTFWFTVPYETAQHAKPSNKILKLPPILVLVKSNERNQWLKVADGLNLTIVPATSETQMLQVLKSNDIIKLVLVPLEQITKPADVVKRAVERLLSKQQLLLFVKSSKLGDVIHKDFEDCVVEVATSQDIGERVTQYLLAAESFYQSFMRLSEGKLEGKHLLIVEDNEINRLIFYEMLNDLVAKITMAENGVDALEKLSAHDDIDLIVMDCQMPEMDGYECTQYIRKSTDAQRRNLPIVAATAHVLSDEVTKCYTVGMNDIIQKPFNKHQLIKAIANNL